MARSSVTFNKKEQEKKKLQKKKEKGERKEARKANSAKGASLDDMLAYVDADGNITDTPVDPTKKKEVDPDSISFRTDRKEEGDEDETGRTGTVSFFNESKGYGFIKDSITGDSIFVHANGLLDQVRDRDKVSFETERTPKGLSAIKVKKI